MRWVCVLQWVTGSQVAWHACGDEVSRVVSGYPSPECVVDRVGKPEAPTFLAFPVKPGTGVSELAAELVADEDLFANRAPCPAIDSPTPCSAHWRLLVAFVASVEVLIVAT